MFINGKRHGFFRIIDNRGFFAKVIFENDSITKFKYHYHNGNQWTDY